jgi:hypothetical protein
MSIGSARRSGNYLKHVRSTPKPIHDQEPALGKCRLFRLSSWPRLRPGHPRPATRKQQRTPRKNGGFRQAFAGVIGERGFMFNMKVNRWPTALDL